MVAICASAPNEKMSKDFSEMPRWVLDLFDRGAASSAIPARYRQAALDLREKIHALSPEIVMKLYFLVLLFARHPKTRLTVRWMMEKSGFSRPALYRYLNHLIDMGFLLREKQPIHGNKFGEVEYFFCSNPLVQQEIIETAKVEEVQVKEWRRTVKRIIPDETVRAPLGWIIEECKDRKILRHRHVIDLLCSRISKPAVKKTIVVRGAKKNQKVFLHMPLYEHQERRAWLSPVEALEHYGIVSREDLFVLFDKMEKKDMSAEQTLLFVEEAAARKPSPKAKRGPRGTYKNRCMMVPEDFYPDAQGIEWAKRYGIGDIDTEVVRFVTWHRSKGTKYADWHYAWRNWCVKSFEFRQQRSAPNAHFAASTTAHRPPQPSSVAQENDFSLAFLKEKTPRFDPRTKDPDFFKKLLPQ